MRYIFLSLLLLMPLLVQADNKDSELEQIRNEIQALKSLYENRIQELESRLKKLALANRYFKTIPIHSARTLLLHLN